MKGGDAYRKRDRQLGGGGGLGGSVVEELPEARLDKVAASFGTGLLRSDVGEGEVNAGCNQRHSGGKDADRRRQLLPRRWVRPHYHASSFSAWVMAAHQSISDCKQGRSGRPQARPRRSGLEMLHSARKWLAGSSSSVGLMNPSKTDII